MACDASPALMAIQESPNSLPLSQGRDRTAIASPVRTGTACVLRQTTSVAKHSTEPAAAFVVGPGMETIAGTMPSSGSTAVGAAPPPSSARRRRLGRILSRAAAISFSTTAVLALVAQWQSRHPVRVVNSTSHWWLGDEGARTAAVDARHTVTGFAIHSAASLLWAAVFEAVRETGPRRPLWTDAVALSALAALVDYAIVPRRLTPGWEKVVTPGGIACAYATMAISLVICGSAKGDA